MTNNDMTSARFLADETNGLLDANAYHASVDYDEVMTLAQVAAEGGRVTRLRILGGGPRDGFHCDISYCHATLPSGQVVPVLVEASTNTLRTMKGDLIRWAREQQVNAKALGLLDEGNWSILK